LHPGGAGFNPEIQVKAERNYIAYQADWPQNGWIDLISTGSRGRVYRPRADVIHCSSPFLSVLFEIWKLDSQLL